MVIVLQILGLRWEIIWPLTCKNFSRKLAFNPVQNYYDHCKQKTLKKIAKSFFCELLLQLPAKHFLYKTFEGNCTHFGCILNLESLRISMNACLLWIFNVKVWKSESAFSRLFQVTARNWLNTCSLPSPWAEQSQENLVKIISLNALKRRSSH